MDHLKKFLLVLLTLSLFSGANAQDLKLIFGLNLSKYDIWPEQFEDMWGFNLYKVTSLYKTGIHIGGGIEFTITKNFAFEINGLYFQKGSRIETKQIAPDPEVYRGTESYTLHVASIPAFLKFKPFTGSSPYILGGSEISIILSHIRGRRSRTANTKSFDYGLLAGVGFEIKMRDVTLFIETRYHYGLINISKYSLYESKKTRAIAFVSGFKFE